MLKFVLVLVVTNRLALVEIERIAIYNRSELLNLVTALGQPM